MHMCKLSASTDCLTILYALWKHMCHSLGALVKAVPKDIGGGCSHELLKTCRVRMAMTTHQAMQCRLRICMLIEGGLHAVWICLARLIASDRCP